MKLLNRHEIRGITTVVLGFFASISNVYLSLASAESPSFRRTPGLATTAEPESHSHFRHTNLTQEIDLHSQPLYEDWQSEPSFLHYDEPPLSPLYQSAPGSMGAYTEFQDGYSFAGLARTYYANDQRIEWSGQEETFGAEAIVAGGASRNMNGWQTGVMGEFYLNQPFDRNRLVDTPQRASYSSNFEFETFELSQLYLHTRHGDWLFGLGKMVTPFGRTYFPIYSNNRNDAPFIRTESILWRETGLLFQYDPGIWTFTGALTNGGPNRDTNSSKAGIGRVGIDTPSCAVGASVKWQDGIGSENQKMANNHVGIDAMIRRGPFTLSGEAIYDEYGFRQANFNPDDITWGRSIYFRDQNYRDRQGITGVGYYVDLVYDRENWLCQLNYGEFYPQQIGDPSHDAPTRRAIIKAVRHLNPFADVYIVVALENDLPNAQAGRTRKGCAILTGFQVSL